MTVAAAESVVCIVGELVLDRVAEPPADKLVCFVEDWARSIDQHTFDSHCREYYHQAFGAGLTCVDFLERTAHSAWAKYRRNWLDTTGRGLDAGHWPITGPQWRDLTQWVHAPRATTTFPSDITTGPYW